MMYEAQTFLVFGNSLIHLNIAMNYVRNSDICLDHSDRGVQEI